MLRMLVTAVCVLGMGGAAQAQTIYKDYDYGMAKGVIASQDGVYECEAEYLCLDDQTFQGEPVGIGFTFVGAQLRSVVLDLTESADPYNSILMPLVLSSDWRLISIANPTNGTSLDLVELARLGDVSAVQSFENGALSSGAAAYTLVDYNSSTKASVDAAPNLAALVLSLPEEARFIDFVLNDPEETWYVMFSLAVKAMKSGPALETF